MAKTTVSCGSVLLLAVSGGTDFPTRAIDFLLATSPGSAVQLEETVSASSRLHRGPGT